MDHYYVNDNPLSTGEHQVHKKNCDFIPDNATYIGLHSNCQRAIERAKVTFLKVDGCCHCLPECHPQKKSSFLTQIIKNSRK